MSDKELIGKTIVYAEVGGYGLRLKFNDGSILNYISSSDGESYWEIIDSAKQAEEVRQRVRLIDANGLIDKIENPYERREVARWVDNAPTIDPVKHGQWEAVKLLDDEADFGEIDGVECSVCGGTYHSEYWAKTYFKFCPYCGAKMDGVSE